MYNPYEWYHPSMDVRKPKRKEFPKVEEQGRELEEDKATEAPEPAGADSDTKDVESDQDSVSASVSDM